MALRLSTGLRNHMLQTAGFKDIMADGVISIYSGGQPTTADDAETGSLLATITLSSGSFTAGQADNGLEFDTADNGAISKSSEETWSGAAAATGTAGWFRFYANDMTSGASTSAARFDGAVSTSGAQLNMSSTAITAGATTTIDSFTITLPAS